MKNKYCLTIHLTEWYFFVKENELMTYAKSKTSFLCFTLYKYK